MRPEVKNRHTANDYIWWKHGVVYQIYPRSFYDSNGDGIGDIPGVVEKIDYLSYLGVDAVWLSPVNTSPMHDFGYDICNYREIDPVFGTLNDFDKLIAEAHRRNIKVVMDLVLNHTSYLHPWFIESSSSRDNPKRNWYIWKDAVKGRPPNNWRSAYFECAWEWHEPTGQYYLHSFLKEQPDVNWRCPELREAMFNEIRFWLDRGVDGFRLDVINWFIKDDRFRNNLFSLNPFSNRTKKYNRNRPENHSIVRELRRLIDSYKNRMLVGEVFAYPPGAPELSAEYLGDGTDELHLAFDFSLLYSGWNARKIYRLIKKWYFHIPEKGWPSNVLSNHDQPRSYSRHSNMTDADKRARVAAMLLLTLKGTPFIYYGEEIGMKNLRIPRHRIADPAGKKFWPLYMGRDCARTPMQWSGRPNAGFSTGKLWLPVDMDYRRINVKNSKKDRYSLLNFYRNLISIRRKHAALMSGEWKPLYKGVTGVLAYYRQYGDDILCVVLNFTAKKRRFKIDNRAQWKVLLSSHRWKNEHYLDLDFVLNPYEATLMKKINNFQ